MKVNKTVASISDYIRPSESLVVSTKYGTCDACGFTGPYQYEPVIIDKLAKEWGLSRAEQKAFSARESMFCMVCGCSYRLRALARAVSLHVLDRAKKTDQGSLKRIISEGYMDKMAVAEINSCGVLHDVLKDMPRLSYSEYGSEDESIPNEDLMSLSYADNTFDLVLTSDSLEHVPDPARALREIYRVLKPKGAHIFTVPMRLNRNTVARTILAETGKAQYVAEQSFHGSGEPDYLVWNEFGKDFVATLQAIYPTVSLFFTNVVDAADPSCVIVAYKTGRPEPRHIVETPYIDSRTLKAVYKMYDTKALPQIASLSYDEVAQNQGLSFLAEKINLTAQHVHNLETIVADQRDYVAKQNESIEKLHRQLEGMRRRLSVRIANTLTRVVNRK